MTGLLRTGYSELILFSNSHTSHNNEQIILNGNYVNYVEHAKFLGVMIDNKMNFKTHINYITGKIAKHAGILYRLNIICRLKLG